MSDTPQFESIGTIRYSASGTSSSGTSPDCSSKEDSTDKKPHDWLFFVPDSAHFLKYSGSSYAVFVKSPLAAGGNPLSMSDYIRGALIVKLRTNENLGVFPKESIPSLLQKLWSGYEEGGT